MTDEQDLIKAINNLTEEVRVLRDVVDELREDFSYAIRNDSALSSADPRRPICCVRRDLDLNHVHRKVIPFYRKLGYFVAYEYEDKSVMICNESQELLWRLNIADYPQLTGRDGQNVRKQLLAQAKQVGEIEARPSPFTQVDKRTRLRMIGAGLKSTHADRWKRHNASQFEWLTSEGLTIQDALNEYGRWRESMKELGAFQDEEAA